MADVFISYAREDREAIEKLASHLESAGVSCWWDRQLTAGAKYREQTEAELDAAATVLVVWTKHSISSHWVADEAAAALEAGKFAPITLDGSMPPLGFRQFQVIDFTSWKRGDAGPFNDLLASLARPTQTPKDDPANPAPKAWRWRFSRPGAIGAAAFGFVVFALGGWAMSGLMRPALEPSIAVLPFANVSGDPAKDYLAHGIASELIETLSQIDKLKVVGRGSSFSFKADADPRIVGPALNVANILSGTVSQEGGGIRISFELADASSGRTKLAKTYTAALTTNNIAFAQRYVAEQVAGSLSIAFDIGGTQLPGSGTRSMEAYDDYLQGRETMARVGSVASENLFEKAVAVDPNYAAAWGLLAIAHGAKSWNRATPAEGRAEQDAAYAMAKKAVMLDAKISTSQAVLANLATTQHAWGEAETASLRAIDLSVNEIALTQRQFILLRSGRVTEADGLYPALEKVAPHAKVGVVRRYVLAAVGRLDELRAIIETPEWKQSDDVAIQVARLEALIDLGGPADEVRKALEAIARQPDRTVSQFAKAVLTVFDDKAKARRALRSWYEGPGFQSALKYELIPFLAAWYGDTDLVLRVWRDDLPVNVVRMTQVWGPAYAPARSHPSFKTLMRDMGLVQYWRTYRWADKCRAVGASDFECG
jgi:TolB-like protein